MTYIDESKERKDYKDREKERKKD